MDTQMLTQFFLWCTVLNVALFALGFAVWMCASDRIYRLHSRWFPMPRERFNAVFYALMGMMKIAILVFNLIPFIALSIMG
jgi:hypothetical protein